MSPLSDFVEFVSGGTPSRARLELWDGEIPWITGADISESGAITPRAYITRSAVRESSTQVLPAGTVLLVTRTAVGKVGVLPAPMAINQDITGVMASDRIDTRYLRRFLQAKAPFLVRKARGATIKGVTRADVASLEIDAPPLEEQRRIAAILDRADAIRAKRRQVLAHFDSLAGAIFRDMFGELSHEDALLGELAAVTSGITKGRRTEEPTTPTPYLAVANVQAGWLDLGAFKSIDATDAERERYALRSGDVVLTEGGDPDKLGRGTVWRDELPLCLHQNHIFRVRPDQSKILPDYLAAFIASSRARSYFLRNAKQTTGIASINMTQLRALPVPVPPLKLQRLLVARTAAAIDARARIESALAADDELLASLQSRAFRGEL